MNNNETNLIINLNEVCRVCLLKTECMVSLANVDNEDILKLLGKLSSVSNLEIEINDVYPSNLCKVCEEKVLQFYEFQMQAQKSHNLMLEFVNQPPEFVNVEEDDEAKVEYTDEELNEKTDQRTSTNQTMRLQQYSAEAVNEAVKRFRDRIPKHTDCIRCTFKSASTRSLGVHVARLHKEVKDSWCSYCNQLFDNLSEHKSQHLHDCLKCEFCNKTLLSTSHFLEHLASHSSERAHRCQVCDKSFISKRHLLSHYRIHSVEKPFKCHCGVTFLTTNTLRAHINKNHVGTKMVCEMCQEEFEGVEVYEGHSCFDEGGMNVTKKIDILPQNFCTECNKKVRSLVNHKKKFHNPSGAEGVLNAPSTSLLCTYCGKQFKTNSKLNVHIRVHTGETPYKCRYCLKQMGTRNQLVVHERVHTGEKPHICRVCGKGFAQTSVLNTHMRLHTGRPELCTICLKRFCRPAELRLHMRQHTGEKPYCCAECGQTFKQKSHLVEHTKTHSNERPFPCAYCDKAFKQNSSLKAHTQIHLGKKPFKCSQCTYACRQSYSLHQHMLQHDKDLPDPQRPHKCLVCHKTFTTHAMMYSHYTSVHADDEAMGKIEPVE